jgi:hypothetical protein
VAAYCVLPLLATLRSFFDRNPWEQRCRISHRALVVERLDHLIRTWIVPLHQIDPDVALVHFKTGTHPHEFPVTDLTPALLQEEPVAHVYAGSDRNRRGLIILVANHDLAVDRGDEPQQLIVS